MITFQQIEQLQQFQNGSFLVTSCYLNFDRSQMSPQSLKIRAKDLLQSARHDLQSRAASHGQRDSLQRDFERIEKHLIEDVPSSRQRGLAIFACTGEKFWQTYRLPRLVRNVLIADHAPYLRPLLRVLAEYRRHCVVLVDRAHGRLFEAYMGEIHEHPAPPAPSAPRHGREGGFGGRDERNRERHHDAVVAQHYQQVADRAFALFKQHQFDSLLMGGPRDALNEFKQHLHPYLRQRWVADFTIEPGKVAVAEVLTAVLELEEHIELDRELKATTDLVQRATRNNNAVTGITPTLQALSRGEAQALLIEDGYEVPGFVCPSCRLVSAEARACPQCHLAMAPVPDVVDEAVGLALNSNCQVQHIRGVTALREAGRIGALLRY